MNTQLNHTLHTRTHTQKKSRLINNSLSQLNSHLNNGHFQWYDIKEKNNNSQLLLGTLATTITWDKSSNS